MCNTTCLICEDIIDDYYYSHICEFNHTTHIKCLKKYYQQNRNKKFNCLYCFQKIYNNFTIGFIKDKTCIKCLKKYKNIVNILPTIKNVYNVSNHRMNKYYPHVKIFYKHNRWIIKYQCNIVVIYK